MTDNELVERFYRSHMQWHYRNQRTQQSHGECDPFCLIAAVREAVLKRVRVCDKCEGSGGIVNGVNLMPCPTCHGRGVTESET